MSTQTPKVTSVFVAPLTSFEEVRQVLATQLNYLQQHQASQTARTSFNGSRLMDVGSPQQPGDAVNLGYLRNTLAATPAFLGSSTPQARSAGGFLNTTQAGLTTVAGTLGGGQTGLLVFVTDFGHVLEWTGSGWQRGPGDSEHSDSFQWLGAAPSDVGWHACDGGTATYLQYNGSLGTRVLPDLTTPSFLEATKTTYSPVGTSAAVPTISGVTEVAATGISVSPATAGTGSIAVGTGTTTTVLTPPFAGGGGVTDPNHAHGLNSADASISLAGGPPVDHLQMILYYRL